jgi:hypothetical protein
MAILAVKCPWPSVKTGWGGRGVLLSAGGTAWITLADDAWRALYVWMHSIQMPWWHVTVHATLQQG